MSNARLLRSVTQVRLSASIFMITPKLGTAHLDHITILEEILSVYVAFGVVETLHQIPSHNSLLKI